MTSRGLDLFEGAITASGFADGNSVVAGTWARSPLGPFVDVMWRDPAGVRRLLAPTRAVADYVADLYRFDEVAVVSISGGVRGEEVAIDAGPLRLRALLAPRDWRSWLFALRPRSLRRSPGWIEVEDRLARPFIGALLGGGAAVRAAGTAPGGQREWYGADDWRAVADARLTVDGRDAGPMAAMPPDFGVGLSAFPRRPASVRLGTLIDQRDQMAGRGSAGGTPG